MAKTKTESKTQKKHAPTPAKSAEELYALALESFHQLDVEGALQHARCLLHVVDPQFATGKSATPAQISLPALNLLGEISIETGDETEARKYFELAVKLDPKGELPEEQGGGAEKFLWLAQLSDEGGFDSVGWYERGVAVLKAQIETLTANSPATLSDEDVEILLEEKRARVAEALCSVVEIYMTDLSWEDDAERKCETLVTEALMFAPQDPSVLQTLASVRLSQVRFEEARSSLRRSMDLWKDLDPDDDAIPDFATRISLARLLMEAEMEDEAMVVLERLALEDDTSVEACYLGGWCLHLMAEKQQGAREDGQKHASRSDEDGTALLQASRKWLTNTVRLYDQQQYEDDRLRQHTDELLHKLTNILGPGENDMEEVEEWIDEEDSGADSGDEEMAEDP